jgi:hypothetical protein
VSGSNNALTQRRKDLEALLKAGGLEHSFADMPEAVTPPFVYVAPGDPYVSYEGAAFGSKIAHYFVVPVAQAGVNEVTSDELDTLLLAALAAIEDHDDFYVVDVDVPGHILINGQKHPAVSINVQIEIPRSAP